MKTRALILAALLLAREKQTFMKRQSTLATCLGLMLLAGGAKAQSYSNAFDTTASGSTPAGVTNIGPASFVVNGKYALSLPNSLNEIAVTDGDTCVFTGAGTAADVSERFDSTVTDNQNLSAQVGCFLRCSADGSQGYVFNLSNSNGLLNVYRKTGGSTYVAIANSTGSGAAVVSAAGTPERFRAQIVGSQLSWKAWPSLQAEPLGWNFQATDTGISGTGYAGIRYANSNTDPTKITVVDNLVVSAPAAPNNAPAAPIATTPLARPSPLPIVTFQHGAYDSSDIANPDAFYDAPHNRWVMDYAAYDSTTGGATSGKWTLCLAYAAYNPNDAYYGLGGPWTRDAANPIDVPLAGEGYIAGNGSIRFWNGQYVHLYQTGGTPGLAVMTSPDLHTWTRRGVKIAVGAAGQPDAGFVSDPSLSVSPDGTSLVAVYIGGVSVSAGAGNTGTQNQQRTFILATSTDGLTWTKQGPLVAPPSTITQNAGEPTLTRDNLGGYHLTFDAGTTTGVRRVGAGYSPDGATWTWWALLGPGAAGAFDSVQLFDSDPHILPNGNMALIYAGGTAASADQGMRSQIGFALLPASLPRTFSFGSRPAPKGGH